MTTTKTHVARLLLSWATRDHAQLVIAAYEAGLVGPASGAYGTQALNRRYLAVAQDSRR